MNERIVIAQANTNAATSASSNELRVVQVLKPQNGQALTLNLGFQQKYKLDLSQVANEKLTFVHVGEKLVILFDNQSTVTVEPFFDSTRNVLGNISFDMGAGRILDGAQFAAAFPISDDQSILPAAGDGQGGNAQAGANFSDPSVDPLGGPDPLALLGQEELGNFTIEQRNTLVQDQIINLIPTVSGSVLGLVEEESLTKGIVVQPSDTGDGNEDTNDVDGNDADTAGDDTVTTHVFSGTLAGLVLGGDPPITFLVNAAANGTNVVDGTGANVTSINEQVTYLYIDSTTIHGVTNGEGGQRLIFILQINPDGSFTFTLNDQIDHHVLSVDDGTNPQGIFEETLNLDLTPALSAHDATPDYVTFPPGTFQIGVIDDTPIASDTVPGSYDGEFYAADPVDDEGATANTGFGGNPGGNGDVFGEDNTTYGYLNYSPGADNIGDVDFLSLDNTAAPFKAIYNNGGVAGQETVTYHWDGATHTLTAIGDTSGDTIFTLTILNLETGQFSFELKSALVHSDLDETVDLEVVLPFTVTDFDGDKAIANLTISFDDDTPEFTTVEAGVKVVIDESPFAQNDADDISGIVPNALAVLFFSPVANKGNDPHTFGLPLGFALGSGAIVAASVSYGADGAAASGALSYAFVLGDGQGTDSGLTTTDGQQILLYEETYQGTTFIVGRVGDENGGAAFALSVNGDTGEVALAQWLSVFHDDPGSHDEEVTLQDGALAVQVTATDGDGDSISQTTDVSALVGFQDDGPTVFASARRTFSVRADESTGNQQDDVDGPLTVFDNITDKGDDPDLPGTPLAFATSSSSALNVTPLFGVDGPYPTQSIQYSLTINGGNGTLSGLALTDGTAIRLYAESDGTNNWVVGRVDGIGPYAGQAAFAIYINPNSGVVSTVEYLSLEHGDPGNANETVSLADNTLLATVTITDGDLDTDSDSADISGRIRFRDDAPSANTQAQIVASVDEDALQMPPDLSDGNTDTGQPGEEPGTGLAVATGGPGALDALVNFGADGKGEFGLKIVAPTDSGFKSQDGRIWIASDGSTLTGYVDTDGTDDGTQTVGSERIVFTLIVGADGSYAFTLLDQIDHPSLDNLTGDDTENLLTEPGLDLSSYIAATDGDGDPATLAAGTFVVQVLDDIPVVSARDATETEVTTTETLVFDLKGGNDIVGGVTTNSTKGIWVTGEDLNDTDDTANTSNNSIGIGNGQIIDGQGTQGQSIVGPEILTLKFFENVDIPNGNDPPTHGAAYDVNVFRFSVDAAEAQQNDDAVVFVQVRNNNAVVSPNDYTITINGLPPGGAIIVHEVYDGVNLVGYVFENVPDDADFEVTSATGFDEVKVGNYNGYQFVSDSGGGTTSVSTGNSFKVYGLEADIFHTEIITETFMVSHDETSGVNTSADPNAADDVDGAGHPAALDSGADVAIGYAKSAASVLGGQNPLFGGSVGADEDGTWSFAITDKDGDPFDPLDNVDSGLKTIDSETILLMTDSGGTLVGFSNSGVAFKVHVDADGFVWIAQYQAIYNDLAGSSDVTFDDIATVAAALHIKATLTDFDGDSTSVVSEVALKVQFQDDGPVAFDDVNTATENGPPVTGNLLTDGTADQFGTDGGTGIFAVSNGSTTIAPDADGEDIAGQFGTLTVFADGSYSYLPNLSVASGSIDSFTYTILDNDGDYDTATLIITFEGDNNFPFARTTLAAVDDDGLGAGNPASTVDDLDADAGEAGAGVGNESVYTGTLNFGFGGDGAGAVDLAAMHGQSGVVIGQETVEFNWDGVDTLTATIDDGGARDGTDLFRVVLNPLTGAFTVTLLTNVLHAAGPNEENASDPTVDLTYTVTDFDNSSTTGTLTITFDDDAPSAADYPGGSFAEGAGAQNIGDAITLLQIAIGADGFEDTLQDIVFTNTSGTGGLLSIDGNGDLIYTPPAVADNTSGPVVETFSYTVIDGDGDSVTRQVTFSVTDTGITEVSAGSTLVDEDDLPVIGNNDVALGDDTPDTTGQISYTLGADAIGSVVLSTTGNTTSLKTLTGDTVDTIWDGTNQRLIGYVSGSDSSDPANQVFLIAFTGAPTNTGVGYSVTLQQPLQHPGQDDPSTDPTPVETAFEDNLSITVNVLVTDADNSTNNTTFTVGFDDDLPVANADSGPVTEGALLTVLAASGVLANDDAGADGATLVGVRAAGSDTITAVDTGIDSDIQGAHGVLHLNADGSYTYQSTANDITSATTDIFVYTIRDGDGDLSTTTLTINLSDVTLVADNQTKQVDEAALDTVQDDRADPAPDDLAASALTGSDPNSDAETVAGQLNVTNAVSYALTGSTNTYGTLQLNSDGSYVYTLTSNHLNATSDDGAQTINGLETYQYTATDANGNTVSGTITIDIADDVPQAYADASLTVVETDGATAGVNLLANDTLGADGATLTHVNLNDGNGFVAIDTGSDLGGGVYGFATTLGVYTFKADGSWTFDPNANLNNASGVSADFSYRITDGDGDTSTATQAVTINDGTPAATPAAVTLDLNEAALDTTGATGSDPLLTSEVDNAPALSFTAGSDDLVSFAFSNDLSGLVTDLNGDTTADIFWVRDSGTQIRGYLDAGHSILAVTLALSAPGSIAAGASGNVTVTATLSDNLQHQNALLAQIASIGSIGVDATDTDNDVTTGTVSINVQDDVPDAGDDTWGPTITGPTVLTGLFTNDTFGADGVDTTNAVAGSVTVTNGLHGTVTYNDDGTFTYTPTGVYVGADSFTYTIKDADGDTSIATVTLDVQTNSEPEVTDGTSSLTVYEAALDLVKSGADLAAGVTTGTNPSSTTETAVDTNGLTFHATGESIVSIKFADPNDGADLYDAPTLANLASGTPQWTLSPDGRTLTLAFGGQTALILALSGATGATAGNDAVVNVTATLVDNFAHQIPPSVLDVILGGVKVVATDTSGDEIAGTVTVNVVDDAPLAPTPDVAALINASGNSFTGALDTDSNISDNLGADGGSVRFSPSIDGDNSGLTSNGAAIYYYLSVDGLTLTASTATSSGAVLPANTVFTVAMTDGVTDTYQVTMNGTVDATTNVTFSTLGGYDFKGGNTNWSGFVPDGQDTTPVNDDSADLLVTPIGVATGVSGTANSIGASKSGAGGNPGGQNIGAGEGLRLNFVSDLQGTPASTNYNAASPTHTFDDHYLVNGATVQFGSIGNDRATVILYASNDNDFGSVEDDLVDDSTTKQITSISISHSGTSVSTADDTVIVNLTDGVSQVVTVDGGSYRVGWNTITNAVTVEGVIDTTKIAVFTADKYTTLDVYYGAGTNSASGNFSDADGSFTLTGFGATAVTKDPTDIILPIELVDGDGDTVGANLAIVLAPAGSMFQNFSASGVGVSATASSASGEHIIGSAHNDTLTGDGAANMLSGGAGNDTLVGGADVDYLAGGSGADNFRFTATSHGMDHILDFSSAEGDLIQILGSAFGGLSAGTLDPSLFSTQTNGTFDNGAQRFSFDQASDTLFYDADGSGATAAIALAKLENGAHLTNTDIQVV